MKISSYNPSTMALISDDVTGINFGNLKLGDFCANTVVIKPVADTENITLLGMYLEDRANLDHTRFGLYKSQTPVLGITPGDSRLDTYLMEAAGVSDYSQFSDYRISYDVSDPEYTWLDVKAGTNETTLGTAAVNFRFVFEYN
jgi:hypothetical protein